MRVRTTFFAIIVGLLVMAGFDDVTGRDGKPEAPPSPVEVARIETRTVIPETTLLGDIEAYTEGAVHTEVRGLVESFPVKEGDFVKQGDVLAELNSSQLNLELEIAQQEKEEYRVVYEQEQRELDRFKMLSESKSVSLNEFEREMTEAQKSRFQMRRLEALIARLKDLISKKTIRAPFDGYIVNEHVHEGMWVEAGGRIVEMVRVNPIYVVVPFPQKALPLLKLGGEATVRVAGLEPKTFTGKVSAIVSRGDTGSRTFPVKILLPNPDHELKPGMLAYVVFRVGKPKEALVAPKDAVVITPSQSKEVYRVREDKAFPVTVETGPADDSFVTVKGTDLAEGQLVVTVGNERLRPGQRVRIVTGTERETAGSTVARDKTIPQRKGTP